MKKNKKEKSEIDKKERIKKFDKLIQDVEKAYGKNALVVVGDDTVDKTVESFSSGSLSLDIALGIGGYPRGRIIEIYGQESSGKCLHKDSYILTAKNGYQKIEDLFKMHNLEIKCIHKEVEIKYPLINYQGEIENTTHFTYNAKKPLYGIKTKSGFIHKSTAKHPYLILTKNGNFVWKWAMELLNGDILVNKKTQIFGESKFSNKTMYAFGLLLADGTLSDHFSLTNDDDCIKYFIENDFCKSLKLTGIRKYKNNEKGSINYHFNVGRKGVLNWYKKWGLNRCTAKDKCIPNWIMGGCKENIINLIKGYVDAESYIGEYGIEICSASHTLLYQIKLLLSQFNIKSYLNELGDVKGYEDNDYYRLMIYGQDVDVYYNEIGTNSKKRNLQFKEFYKKTYFNKAIPNIRELVLDFSNTISRTTKLREISGDLKLDEMECSVNRLLKILKLGENQINDLNKDLYRKLNNFLEYDYDAIKEINQLSPDLTFDFAMEKTHTFIADGCITHNTTLTLHAIAELQKEGGSAAFIDAEHALDPIYAQNIGVDLDELLLSQPSCGEEALDIVERIVKDGNVDLIIVDSVAALTPRAEINGEMGDSTMGLHARLMSQAMRKLTAIVHKSKTTIIFLNQIRDKIGILYGSPHTTTGGNALKFYASIRLEVSKVGNQKDGDEIIANKTKVKVVKNKVAPPFRVAEFDIVFGQGISKIGEIVDYAVEYEIVKKSGSWFSYGETKLGQGREGVIQLLRDNEELCIELEVKIKDKIFGEIEQ